MTAAQIATRAMLASLIIATVSCTMSEDDIDTQHPRGEISQGLDLLQTPVVGERYRCWYSFDDVHYQFERVTFLSVDSAPTPHGRWRQVVPSVGFDLTEDYTLFDGDTTAAGAATTWSIRSGPFVCGAQQGGGMVVMDGGESFQIVNCSSGLTSMICRLGSLPPRPPQPDDSVGCTYGWECAPGQVCDWRPEGGQCVPWY